MLAAVGLGELLWTLFVIYVILNVLIGTVVVIIDLFRSRDLSGLAKAACALFLLGVILFCGSLYIRGLTGFHPIVLLTPFGGVALMLGWLALAASAWPSHRSAA